MVLAYRVPPLKGEGLGTRNSFYGKASLMRPDRCPRGSGMCQLRRERLRLGERHQDRRVDRRGNAFPSGPGGTGPRDPDLPDLRSRGPVPQGPLDPQDASHLAPGRIRPYPFTRALASAASFSSDPRAGSYPCRRRSVSAPTTTGRSAAGTSTPRRSAPGRGPCSSTPASAPCHRSPATSAGSPRGHAPGRRLPQRRIPSRVLDHSETTVASQGS
jgi:hypothetical protein